MRIAVFGSTGNVGSRVVSEALDRGHDVTAIVRKPAAAASLPPGAQVRIGDAANADAAAALIAGQDVVISATRPRAGREDDLVAVARSLLSAAAHTQVRLILVGGAATLTIPGKGGTTVLDDPDLPTAWRAIARACADQLAACQTQRHADWTYLSPPSLLEPGERTGHYRLGRDALIVDDRGESAISMEDFAVALLDEVERPRHRRMRFTVGY